MQYLSDKMRKSFPSINRVMSLAALKNIIANHWLDILLWLFIAIAIMVRMREPFIHNPMNSIRSDPGRHFHSAVGFGTEIFSLIEPIGYNLWLAAILKILGHTKIAVAIYTAAISCATTLTWYLWFRECLPSKRLALVGFAIIAALPSWIGIYTYFMPETLLLPLLGLSLYLTWRAHRVQSTGSVWQAAIAWVFTLLTKMSVAPTAIISLTWLFMALLKSKGKDFVWRQAAPSLLLIIFTVIADPLNTYLGLHTGWMWPPGATITELNHAYYLSGSKFWRGVVLKGSNDPQPLGLFESPSFECAPPLSPFSEWTSGRNGEHQFTINCARPFSFFAPRLPERFKQTPALVLENILYFFFSESWPDNNKENPVEVVQITLRWMWPLLTALILIAAAVRRKGNVLLVITVVSAGIYCIQQFAVMEGRYRKPWEGIAIACFLSLLSAKKYASEAEGKKPRGTQENPATAA
jgi:hypothetical protein